MRLIITMLLAAILCLPLFATYSSLVFIPSTDVLAAGKFHLDIDTVSTVKEKTATIDEEKVILAPSAFSSSDVGVEYGVMNRVELGIDMLTQTSYPAYFNAKFQLLTAGEQSPFAAAVGIFGVNPKSEVSQDVIYALGSYKFADAARFTAGAYSGKKAVIGDKHTGFLAGLEYTYGPWWFAVDHMSGKNALGYTSLGVGHPVADNVGLIAQYSIPNDSDVSTEDLLGLQVDINF